MSYWPALCLDCGVDTRQTDEWYGVNDDVWAAAGMLAYEPDRSVSLVRYEEARSQFLCIGCLESRLGRQLTPADFSGAAINQLDRRSARLMDRLGR